LATIYTKFLEIFFIKRRSKKYCGLEVLDSIGEEEEEEEEERM
jgi:hypothetical protein